MKEKMRIEQDGIGEIVFLVPGFLTDIDGQFRLTVLCRPCPLD